MTRFSTLKIASIHRETSDAVAIEFAVPEDLREAFAFEPGQYLTVLTSIEGEEIRRCYSICSGTQEDSIRIGVKQIPDGAFSTHANTILKPGDTLQVMPPDGRFVPARRRNGTRYLAVAVGSGITPILSIMKTVLHSEPASEFTLIYGNKTSQSVMFAEDIEGLKNRHLGQISVFHVLSQEPQDVASLSGRITPQRLQELAAGAVSFADMDEAFICGPQEMIAQTAQTLSDLGMDPQFIHSELFTPSSPRKNHAPTKTNTIGSTSDVIAHITVTLDGKVNSFDLCTDDESIIEAARRAGLDLPYSCHGGMCCTCRCKVESGSASMAVNYSLEQWEMDRGFILACQAQPKTSELALDFDQM